MTQQKIESANKPRLDIEARQTMVLAVDSSYVYLYERLSLIVIVAKVYISHTYEIPISVVVDVFHKIPRRYFH